MLKDNKIDTKWFVLSVFALAPITAYLFKLQLSSWIIQTVIITLIAIISLSWAFLGKTSSSTKNETSNAADRFEDKNNARNVGLKLQGLGQLTVAFEKFKLCPHNHDTANLIYNLATDFQIKGEPENAKQAFQYIVSFEPNFKDIQKRIASFSDDIDALGTELEEQVDIVAEKELFSTQEQQEVVQLFLDTVDGKIEIPHLKFKKKNAI